jgi:hypothetical protein
MRERFIALRTELADALASSNERGTALSLVSGALADAGCVVGPAMGFGVLVEMLAAERDAAEEGARGFQERLTRAVGGHKAALARAEKAEKERDEARERCKSHLCHACGTIWRPATVATVGVLRVLPEGKDDTWIPGAPPDWRKPPLAGEQGRETRDCGSSSCRYMGNGPGRMRGDGPCRCPAKPAPAPVASVIPSRQMSRTERAIARDRISPPPRVEEDEDPVGEKRCRCSKNGEELTGPGVHVAGCPRGSVSSADKPFASIIAVAPVADEAEALANAWRCPGHESEIRAVLAAARRDGMMLPVEASIQVHEEAACGPVSTCPVCAFRIAAERRGMERAAKYCDEHWLGRGDAIAVALRALANQPEKAE